MSQLSTRGYLLRHRRAPSPIVFPVEAEVPEGKRHLRLRTFLFQLLEFALGQESSIGSEQFVYWNARDPRRCLAPDVFVRLGVPDSTFDTWKTWERGGAPELAVEIVSRSDAPDEPWDDKLERYHELGVRELVRFDPKAPEGARIRVWDRVQEDLVEREVEGDSTPSTTLRLYWVVAPIEGLEVGLRLAEDVEGTKLLLSRTETEAQARQAEAQARQAAEARVAALEAELRRRGG
ncbi:MAG TPA: Uma2 family endonuclease [Polyangiaceae bacterium]|nr:Uma2 family endonuclease [Polyangiaceae bacterium]